MSRVELLLEDGDRTKTTEKFVAELKLLEVSDGDIFRLTVPKHYSERQAYKLSRAVRDYIEAYHRVTITIIVLWEGVTLEKEDPEKGGPEKEG